MRFENLILKFEFEFVITDFKIRVKHSTILQSICEECKSPFRTVACAQMHILLILRKGDQQAVQAATLDCNRLYATHSNRRTPHMD